MTTLILIRHGESEANRHGIFAGQIDPDLQMRGQKQAELTARYISSHYNVDKIYSSDLQRAYKTAKPLADILGIEVVKDKNLREICAGDWEGVAFDALSVKHPKDFDVWLNDIGRARCTGGESVQELADRVFDALGSIARKNSGKTVAVALHATPIRAFQSLIQFGSLDKMQQIPWVSNASVTVAEYDSGTWTLGDVSIDAHLAELKTSLPDNV